MPDSDIEVSVMTEAKPVVKIANSQIGLAVNGGTVFLAFKMLYEHMTMVLRDALSDAIHSGCVHLHFAPVKAHGKVTIKREVKSEA